MTTWYFDLIYVFIFLHEKWIVGFHPFLTIDRNPYGFSNSESRGGIIDDVVISNIATHYHSC